MEHLNKRVEQKETRNPLIQLDTNILNAIKSVCKIMTNTDEGTGFLIKLFKDNKEFYCLMTNRHIIEKDVIETKQKIIIYFDTENELREIILDKDKRYIKEYGNINLDITIIEILKEDNINYFIKLSLFKYITEL